MKKTKHKRYQPDGYIGEINKVNNTVIYYNPFKFEAIGFTGRSNKPFFYNFYGSWDLMMDAIEYHIGKIEEKAERKARQKALDAWEAKELLEETLPGDIFVSSWGYEQTNIDYYQVTTVGRKLIWFAKIDKKVVGDAGFMSEHVMPVKDSFCGEPFRKAIKSGYISLSSYSGMDKWKGQKMTQSHYA